MLVTLIPEIQGSIIKIIVVAVVVIVILFIILRNLKSNFNRTLDEIDRERSALFQSLKENYEDFDD